jgi:hypothetical protein
VNLRGRVGRLEQRLGVRQGPPRVTMAVFDGAGRLREVQLDYGAFRSDPEALALFAPGAEGCKVLAGIDPDAVLGPVKQYQGFDPGEV